MYRDVENIEPLTKADMLEFYRTYYLPNAPKRAKASVHLIAQASAADLAANTSSAEKKEKLVEVITQMLNQLGLEDADGKELAKKMDKVDISSGDMDGILGAVGSYLQSSLNVAAEQAEQVMEQGKEALAMILPSLGIVSQSEPKEDEADGQVATNGDTPSKTIVIEDVKAFKASMPLSAGARPVKDLSEFEELEAKL